MARQSLVLFIAFAAFVGAASAANMACLGLKDGFMAKGVNEDDLPRGPVQGKKQHEFDNDFLAPFETIKKVSIRNSVVKLDYSLRTTSTTYYDVPPTPSKIKLNLLYEEIGKLISNAKTIGDSRLTYYSLLLAW